MTNELAREIADRIAKDAAELSDRTSPDDWPEAMLVTADELIMICERNIVGIIGAAVADEREACHRIARTYNPLKHNRPAGIHQSGISEAGAVNAAADIASAIAARGVSKSTKAHLGDCECRDCWEAMER